MPYDVSNPPEKLKNLSDKEKRQWIKIFNSCWEEHHDDAKCHRMAWGTVGKGKKSSEGMSPEDLRVGDYVNSRQGEGYLVAQLATGQYMLSMKKRDSAGRRVGWDEIFKVHRQGRWVPVVQPIEARIARIAGRLANA